MILFTTGSEQFPFRRFIKMAEAVARHVSPEPVVVQLGSNPEKAAGCEGVSYFSHEGLRGKMKEARIVVTHAGVGNLLLCREVGKVPVVVPRRKKLREHVDDHQIELSRHMEGLGYARVAETPEELLAHVASYGSNGNAHPSPASLFPGLAQALTESLKNGKH